MSDAVRSCNKLLIGQFLGLHDPGHGVLEDIGVVPVVEPPLQFLQVAVHMLDTHPVKGSYNRTLEQAPHSLDPVGVNVTDNPLLSRVPDSFMSGIRIPDPDIGLQFVGIDGLGLVRDVPLDEVMQGAPLDVRDALDSDLPSLSLDGPGNPRLTFPASRSYVALLPADQGFVHFNDPKESRPGKGIVAHGLADAVGQIPGCAVRSDTELPMELTGRDSFLGFTHEVDRQEPLAKRQMGIVYDRSRGYGKVVFATMAVPLAPILDLGHTHVTATGAGDPIRPAQGFQIIETGILGIETVQKGDNIHGSDS